MTTLGIDIGTTTVSASVIDGDAVLHTETHSGPGFLPAPDPSFRLQDIGAILALAREIIDRLTKTYSPAAIGLTGQMHGIVPVDKDGMAVGPLYTWQDGRGNATDSGEPFHQTLSREIGLPLATGYGLVTHAYNLRRGLADPRTVSLTTAAGYLGMRLTGRKTPLLHASDAASLGGYRLDMLSYAPAAVEAAGGALPDSTFASAFLGETADHLPVAVAIGDNQASFLGAVGCQPGSLLVNIGTGAQVSVSVPKPVQSNAFDTRPFIDGTYLLAVSPLCGGRSYAMLEKFFRECAALAGAEPSSLYEVMNRLALQSLEQSPDEPLVIDTRFCGTRADPEMRGGIFNLGEDTFTPAHFVRATLEGMTRELLDGYLSMKPFLSVEPTALFASGNAVKRNGALQRILSARFNLPLSLSPYEEEAARGAALFAARCR